MPLPGLIEYLTAQERPGGGGKLAHRLALQYNVPYIPAATATLQSLSSVITAPQRADHAEIGFHISCDRRVNPDVLDIQIMQYGAAVVQTFLATDIIQDGIDTFLVVTADQPVRWEIENLSRFPQFLVATMHYLSVNTLDDLALLRMHVRAFSRGPHWDPTTRYGGLSADDLVERLDRAAAGGKR